jgi:hypothetical protein
MKRFLSAVGLCAGLLVLGLFVLMPSSGAQNARVSVLPLLLNQPAPPPPNPLVENAVRDERFYKKNNVPKDDAPIDDLMDYWTAQNQYNPKYTYTVAPSEKTLERIIGEIEKKPELLSGFLNVLANSPDAAEFVKRLYDRESAERNLDENWRTEVKEWLTYNSTYFIDELAEQASFADETGEYVLNQNEVLALARLDWDKARALVERFYNSPTQPILQTLARWALYERALREGSTSDVERYRKELQETVEDKTAKPGNRDLAMDALVESGDFPGRDDWYYSLLEDETLFDLRVNGTSYTSLTTLLNHSAPEKYLAKMLELIKSDNQAVRNAAARNLGTLIDEKNPDVIRALLPWLENPKWAKEVGSERANLVRALIYFQMPESVPGLIAVLNESQKKEVPVYYNGNVAVNSNIATTYNANITVTTRETETFPYRIDAITALAVQKDSRAVPALRGVLPLVDDYQRSYVVNALLLSNGFSIPEQLDALESVALYNAPVYMPSNTLSNMPMSNTTVVTRLEAPTIVVSNTNYGGTTLQRPFDANELRTILGTQIVNNPEPTAEFVNALINRIEVLERENPALAVSLRTIMTRWRGAAINSLFLRDLKNGKADLDAVIKLLSVRRELREKQSREVYDLRSGTSQTAYGISACLLEDAGEYNAILSGDNVESKTALLACARMIRAPLPVRKVAEYLKNPNALLALAAELYLESEDSIEARQMVLAAHPNEAKVLGARTFFSATDGEYSASNYLSGLFLTVGNSSDTPNYYFYNSYFEELNNTQEKLREEVLKTDELAGVYAYDKNFIRIYKDKAVFSWEDNPARYRERELTKEEFDNLKDFLSSQRVDELPPFLSSCGDGCVEKELLMLGRGGGRRVFVRAGRMPPFFAALDEMFADFRKPSAKLRYYLEKSVTGLEILFADENLQARMLWKNGDDFRVLIEDAERRKQIDKQLDLQDENDLANENVDYEQYEAMSEKRRQQRKFEHLTWHKFAAGKLVDFAAQPPQIEYFPVRDSFPAQAEIGAWQARAANLEIRADNEGLYKLSRGAFTKIRSGYYANPLVTANGRWAIVTKYDDEMRSALFRVNLLTNREFKIAVPEETMLEPVAFVAALNKVLLYAGAYYEEKSDREGTFYLLDAETGAFQETKGEVRPLLHQDYRPLQPAAGADEFWAAIPTAENETQFGVYNAKTLSFKPLLKIPQISFYSAEMWVDAGKIYFVYEGHLLSLPLPKG